MTNFLLSLLSVEYVFASAKMPKFHGQMQNISVIEGTPQVTFKCTLTNGFYSSLGRHKVRIKNSLEET